MQKHNPANERIKRRYFTFLKEAKRHSEPTLDAAAKALSRFEAYTRYRDFKAFHFEQAVAFKKHLAEQKGRQSREKLSKATLHGTLTQLKRFFQWLAWQPGYKSRVQYADAEYFNLSEKDTRIATAKRLQRVPTLEQVKHVINTMPAATEIERRNRALVAFTLLKSFASLWHPKALKGQVPKKLQMRCSKNCASRGLVFKSSNSLKNAR